MMKDSLNDLPIPFLVDDWFDPLEEAVRRRIRGCIEAMLEGELEPRGLRFHLVASPRSRGTNRSHEIFVRQRPVSLSHCPLG